ncbi:hypothetical protein GWK47_049168 [Chionoecetes opilio]|uniref:Uncharacterized protein n=1 Tax=Chionoecetes opilio TaxID=41210 RepID=A0A8J4YAB4_CHIOP|nr:hypothetical protein GWK47_049168 [Chionoecetes opilio]
MGGDAFTRSLKESDGRTFVPKHQNIKKVFTDAQEHFIEEYSIKISRMFYGLSTRAFRRMVLKYAEAVGSPAISDVWRRVGMATRDWYYGYMFRHPRLALKAPEGMSLARAMAFNRVNVEVFFKAYVEAVERHSFMPARIFNLDESGLSTVMKPSKLQPLDVSVFGPFKSVLRSIQDDFKLSNTHVPITEHMLPEMACKAWDKLREKEKKKAAREEKKRRSEEKKREKKREQEARQAAKRRRRSEPVEASSSDEEAADNPALCDDSSEYSDEFAEELEHDAATYPFVQKEPEVGDFVLVQLVFKGKRSEELVHFVAKVISLEEDGRLQLDFLRIKSPLLKDTFHFPAIGMSTVSTAAGCWGSSQSARGPPNDKQT